ncbi:MAG TPA: hypothetical protein VJ913_05025 [Actinomycetota bacterium]|nr:hypothetical protein [Actinomycetota bacterium]
MSKNKPAERSVEPDPDERDEHAYEDTWYRALKAQSERRHEDRPPTDEGDPPTPER